MYRGASADNECPLVVDTSTPSCGSSRFGCWVCTVVTSDKSMQSMIQNDAEKEWMMPLLDFRNEIGQLNENGFIDDRDVRDYRRLDGTITLHRGRTVHGPYTKERREHLLRRLLEMQREIRENGPTDVGEFRLISDEELCEVRRIWVTEKFEFDDALPRIYEEAMGTPFPFADRLTPGPFGKEEWDILTELSAGNPVLLDLQASLIGTELQAGAHGRKVVIQDLEDQIRRCYYESEDDAVAYKLRQAEVRSSAGSQIELWSGESEEVEPE
jgi:DNA sulfur modification protein DndC